MVTLPSKKVFSVFIFISALIFAIIIGFGRDRGTQTVNFANNLIAGEKVSVPENPDWQSELGKVDLSPVVSPEEEASIPNTETTVDTVSRTLVSNYLALKQNGTLDQESAQKLVDQSVEYIEKTKSQITLVSDLNIVPDNGKISISEYGENLGNLLKTLKAQANKNEIKIINEAIESESVTKLEELNSIISTYESFTLKLIKMPVPKTFAKAHLDMVSGVRGMAIGLKEMKQVLSDPFKGLTALQLYNEGGSLFLQASGATVNFIKQNNIIYKQGSGGYYLLYGI